MLLGTISETKSRIHPETNELEEWKVVKLCLAKCDNDRCFNFTTRHDLAGSWCSDNCVIEYEEREVDQVG